MSYCRFLEADVYVFMSVGGWLECCACSLEHKTGKFYSTASMLEHLYEHRSSGDNVPDHVFDNIKADDQINFPTEEDKVKKKDTPKESPSPDDITMSFDEFDRATLKQFHSGRLNGMYKCHDIFTDTLARLKQSLEDVWAIEQTGIIYEKDKIRLEKMEFAINTLVTLEDMFFGEYDSRLEIFEGESVSPSKPMSEDEFNKYLDDIEVDDK